MTGNTVRVSIPDFAIYSPPGVTEAEIAESARDAVISWIRLGFIQPTVTIEPIPA